MDLVTLVGSLAAISSTASFAPQVWKIIRSRRARDISAGTYALTVCGFALWTVYGALLVQWPLIATNAICLAMSGFILAMKLLPRRKRETVAETLSPPDP